MNMTQPLSKRIPSFYLKIWWMKLLKSLRKGTITVYISKQSIKVNQIYSLRGQSNTKTIYTLQLEQRTGFVTQKTVVSKFAHKFE